MTAGISQRDREKNAILGELRTHGMAAIANAKKLLASEA
jgi:hypothetical protein